MKNHLKISILVLSSFAATARANNEGTFGAHLGWGIPTSFEDTKGGLDIGVNADWTLSPMVNVGLFATYQMLSKASLPSGDSLFQIPLGITTNFNLLGGPGLYAGLNLGTVVTGQKSGTATSTDSSFSGGGQVGYDFPLTDIMSGGLEFRYIHIFGTDDLTYLMNMNVQVKMFF